MQALPRLVLGAPHSGSGKTAVSTALLAALRRRGMAPLAGKVGPDYIDPGYLEAASGRPVRNLDPWMMGPEGVLASLARARHGADIAVIEGVMGLFDGYGGGFAGSTAHTAQLLGCPVVLLIDARGMAGSAAAVAHGFASYRDDVRVAGVILNRVGSERHAGMLRRAVERGAGLPVLGTIPRDEALAFPERHLGLFSAREVVVAERLDGLADLAEEHLDLDRIISLSAEARALEWPQPVLQVPQEEVRLAVARDEAFCFYYQDNLDLLAAAGARLMSFSPLAHGSLPDGTRGIYLGGGYPELHAERLEANSSLREEMAAAAADGVPIYAECGGLLYLCDRIITEQGTFRMAGLVPAEARMGREREGLGYVEIEAVSDSPVMEAGARVRGHRHHWSWLTGEVVPNPAYRVLDGQSAGRTEGFAGPRLAASYVHLHFGAWPRMAERFVEVCRDSAA